MALTEPGALHRIAIVVRDVDEAAQWFAEVLGAHSRDGMLDGSDPERRREVAASEGADMRLVWLGGAPIVLLGPAGHDGPAAKFLARYGPGVHSLAWEINDMWALEHRLRERGIGITGVNVEGRHFFMHPRDTHGLLIEWTDQLMGDAQAEAAAGVICVSSLAWVTGVVPDADATGAFLSEIASVKPAPGRPAGPAEQEHTVDLAVGPVTARLVSPRTPQSRYSSALERGPRWVSVAFTVGDLDTAVAQLDAAGIPTIERDGDRAFTDPAATFGIAFEWTS